jgi:hypothetical protein
MPQKRFVRNIFIIFGVVFIALILWFVNQQGNVAGNWETITNNYLGVFGYIIFIGLTLYAFVLRNPKRYKGSGFIDNSIEDIILGGVIGILFAGLIGQLNTLGILIDEIVTASLTISDIQTIVVIVWVLVGLVKGVTS